MTTITVMDVRLTSSAAEAADHAGDWIARRLRDAVRRRGAAALALSGGSTAPALIAAIVAHGAPWEAVTVWQVDERVAPDLDADRNANQLAELPSAATVRPMPVTSTDLRRAARRYGATLPERFDVVHLGVGPDGHTASWPPGDPVIDSDRPVDLVGEYMGRRRMTLTPAVVNDARARLVFVTGRSKARVVAAWLRGDDSAPISRVRQWRTVVILDRDAASRLPT
jgi:6-phosphogluconolactonase/glucosamine-6-phosphate isomerase/deaminase